MKQHDLNERVKIALNEFLVTDWIILPTEDLEEETHIFNQRENEVKITDVQNILWFAKGTKDSLFLLKEFSLESKISDFCKLPTEYMGALTVSTKGGCILSLVWHGYEFIIVDNIKTKLCKSPILQNDIDFFNRISNLILSA